MTKKQYFLTKKTPIQDNSIPLQQILAPITMEYLEIDSIFEKYPFIKPEMGWTKSDIEALFDSHLIVGYKKDSKVYLVAESFEKLIEYHRQINKR